MGQIARRSSRRYLFRHPWQMLLAVVGIALGVAVVVAIDLANQSAGNAFALSMESVSGKATHQISGGPAGVPDSLYRRLRLQEGIRDSAPIVQSYVTLEEAPGRTFMLLGVDLFAERPFRDYLSGLGLSGSGSIGTFMTEPGTALMLAQTAAELGIETGERFTVHIGSRQQSLKLIGLLEAADRRSRNALEGLLICDIASAQEVLDMNDRLSRIDLIIPETVAGKAQLTRIEALLPPELRVESAGSRSQIMSQMTRAFSLNLTALSLLALIVGMFLIYNTMTFSVVQRRALIGLMRAIGITRREIFRLIIGEAALLGIAGTLLGLGLGILLGKGLVQLITRTINDLYFVITVQSLELSWFSLLKGVGLGIGAAVLAALKPAREATGTAARDALHRSSLESELRARLPRLTLLGLLLAAAGTAILWLPSRNIALSYGGILLLIIGFTLWTPLVVTLAMRLLRPLMAQFFGMLGRMATRDITAHLSRTSVAIAALSMAVAATVGIGTMVGSFRATVVQWLEGRLEADVYISAPSLVSRRNDGTMDPAFIEKIGRLPGVAAVNMYREIMVQSGDSIMHVIGSRLIREQFLRYQFQDGDATAIWPRLEHEDVVIVSETYAYRRNLSVGDAVRIPTDRGIRRFRIVGIFYDYVSDLGLIQMSMRTFHKYWNDRLISGASAVARPGVAPEVLIDDIRALVPAGEQILIRSNRAIRETTIEVFDRTFVITSVLRLLAVAVAFIGVLSALMSLQLERSRELGILRANGLTPGELWGMVSLQTGLMGLVSGLLALPMGTMLSAVLIYIINRRSFGWTLQFQFIPEIFIQAVILALVAAVLAGLYPAFRMARTSPALALREE